jgi:thiosulfate reductase cytochrome b subunit
VKDVPTREMMYTRFERLWHWSQAALIIFLGITGFEVHDSVHIFGYEKAVIYHRFASYALLGLIIFAAFWHFTTGEWKQYVPTVNRLVEQIIYYSWGIFHNAEHPTHKTRYRKLNPLQILVYLGFKLVLIPLMVITGLLYMFHKTYDSNGIVVVSRIELEPIALWHTLGAFALVAFLLGHVYMTTTGKTPTSNIREMITGYEDGDEAEAEAEEEEAGVAT